MILFLGFSYMHNNLKYMEDSTFELDLVVWIKAFLWDFIEKRKRRPESGSVELIVDAAIWK